MYMRKKESLEDMVERRNKRLLMVFASNDIQVRLVGDPQKPAIVKNEKEVLSCFVKNFDLHFTKEPFSDIVIKSIKLKSIPEINKRELEEVLEMCTHRPVYKLKLTGNELFLVGYNYLNSQDSVGRYPVFAKHKPKVYFDKSYAEKVATALSKEGYNIVID
jgi:hypothetical protein